MLSAWDEVAIVRASKKEIVAQIAREKRICDGAQHILAAEGGSEELRDQVHVEWDGAQARMARLRQALSSRKMEEGETFGDGERGMNVAESSYENERRKFIQLLSALQSSSTASLKSKGEESALLPLHGQFLASGKQGDPSLNDKENLAKIMGPPLIPSMTRQAQRARSAALAAAASQGRPQHQRTPSHVNGLGTLAQHRISLIVRITEILKGNVRVRYECPTDTLIDGIFPCLADAAGKEVRASAYRLLRHAIVRPPWRLVLSCRQRGLDLFLVRTFLRDVRFSAEKEQALKLVRWIMDCGSISTSSNADHSLMSLSIIRAIASASDNGDERLRVLYLETLAELAVHDLALLAKGGGMRAIVGAVSDPNLEVLPELMQILLHLVDLPHLRSYFHSSFDVVSVLSGFTDGQDESQTSLTGTSHAASLLFRSWSGLLFMCLNDRGALKSIIASLRINSEAIRASVLDMFLSFFALVPQRGHIRPPKTEGQSASERSLIRSSRFNLIDAYILLTIVILLECGIPDALIHLIETRSPTSRKAMDLLRILVRASANRLPNRLTHQLYAMPALFQSRFAGQAQGGRIEERERASTAFTAIEQYAAAQVREQRPAVARQRATSNLPALRPPVQLDDNAFRLLLLEANVLSTKDYAKWNVDALQNLFENVLVHPKRLEEAMRASKVVRRVLSFYHPFSMRFSVAANSSANQRFVKLGRIVLQRLLSTAEGAKYLAEDGLMREIGDCLDTEVLSEQRLQDTLVGGYFEFMGILSRSKEGVQLLLQANLFSALFRIMDRRKRVDIARYLLRHIDFSVDGHCRILLSRILAHQSRSLRIEAMRTVAHLFESNQNRWLVRLLVGQLYDPNADVRELASDMLLQACTSSSAILDMVVSMRPMLHQASHSLLLKFLSTASGLEYLMQGDYIDHEMDEWFHRRNLLYANQIEAMLSRAFSIGQSDGAIEGISNATWDGSAPPHFYGELVKTPEGCALLERKGHFAEFACFIRLHASEESDCEVLTKLKSILWAVGSIGASRGGLPFLENEALAQIIVDLAESTSVASLRGTCFFVMGLIATTQSGAELLQDCNWDICVCTSLQEGLPYAHCLPSKKFLTLPQRTEKTFEPVQPSNTLPPPSSRVERLILAHLASLGNAIIATKASRALTRLKERYPALFKPQSRSLSKGAKGKRLHSKELVSVDENISRTSDSGRAMKLFVRAVCFLDSRPLRQSVRRYIWELFEVRLDLNLVEQFQRSWAELLEEKVRFELDTFPAWPMGTLTFASSPKLDSQTSEPLEANLTSGGGHSARYHRKNPSEVLSADRLPGRRRRDRDNHGAKGPVHVFEENPAEGQSTSRTLKDLRKRLHDPSQGTLEGEDEDRAFGESESEGSEMSVDGIKFGDPALSDVENGEKDETVEDRDVRKGEDEEGRRHIKDEGNKYDLTTSHSSSSSSSSSSTTTSSAVADNVEVWADDDEREDDGDERVHDDDDADDDDDEENRAMKMRGSRIGPVPPDTSFLRPKKRIVGGFEKHEEDVGNSRILVLDGNHITPKMSL